MGTTNVNESQIGGYPTLLATQDGAPLIVNGMRMTSSGLYVAGGPPRDQANNPSLLSFDRQAGIQGKVRVNGTITATTIGATTLTFSSPPITIIPGQKIQLSGGAAVEDVIVSPLYSPDNHTTIIPLLTPVVWQNQVTAKWDTYGPLGPGFNYMLPYGIAPFAPVTFDSLTGQLIYLQANAANDNLTPERFLQIVPGLYNPTTAKANRQRSNYDASGLISVTNTQVTQQCADQINYNHRGIRAFINITAIAGGSVTMYIEGKEPQSNTYYVILQTAALASTGLTMLTIYPGIPVVANSTANDVLPPTWRVRVGPNAGNNTSYGVGASLMV